MRMVLSLVLGLMISMGYAERVPIWETVPGTVTTKAERLVNEHIYDVSVPTIEFFPAANPQTQPLPLVFVIPGGGYGCQAYIKEGTDVAQWMNAQGFHAAVIKYRIPGDRPGALRDVQEAVRLVQRNATKWKVDTARLGMIGFSAGAHLTARVLAHEGHALAFAMLIYPAYLSKDGVTLYDDVVPATPTVPTFIAQCNNDRAFVYSSIAYTSWLCRKNRPVSAHLYTTGGHGFGLRKQLPEEAGLLTDELKVWLKTLF